jgi:hypothetical protein
MGDPSAHEKDNAGFGQVERVKNKSVGMEIISRMVKRHDDHNGATQQVNGFYPVFSYSSHLIVIKGG